MVKIFSVGMIEHDAKNHPVAVAATEVPNGYIFTEGADGTASAPVAGASGAKQTADLFIALNDHIGDYRGTNKTIPAGDPLNGYMLKAWDGQYLELDEDNITYGDSESYASITAGTTNMVAGTDGKFAIAAAVTYYGLYFKVVEKIRMGTKNGIRVQIVVA